MVSTLPIELVDHIIDVFRYDLAILEICSQVSKTWRNHSLSHLFRAIEVREDTQRPEETFKKTCTFLPECIQLTLTRFGDLLSRRSGRAMFMYTQHLVLRWNSFDEKWPSKWHSLRFPRHGNVNIRSVHIVFEGIAGFHLHEWNLFSATIARLLRSCRRNLQYISAKGSPILIHAMLHSLPDCPQLQEIELGGRWEYQQDVPDCVPLPLPRLLGSLHLPIRLKIDEYNVSTVLQWIQLNANVVKVEGVTLTLTLGASSPISKYDSITSLKLLYYDPINTEHTVLARAPELSHVLAQLPALSVLVIPTHPYAQVPFISASFVDGVRTFSEILSLPFISCPSLRALVILDCSYKWELPEEESIEADASSQDDKSYDWAALDAALALPKWRGIRHIAVSVISRRARNVYFIEQYFTAQACSELPEFLLRGGTVRVLSSTPYDDYKRNQFIDGYTSGVYH